MSEQTTNPTDLSALTDYEILSEIGRGGVSVVYLARDRELEREIAIKVVHDRYLGDSEAHVRTVREARTLAQLHHPNIVTLLGARRLPDGRLALMMQLATGTTLRLALQQQGPMACDEAVQVLRQIASALAYIHGRGIVHRDVKPENVFLEADGHVLLSDLGIAKANDAPSSVTLTGVIVGTPTYMSPEQIDGAELDGRSDQYSLGLLGYELLSGRRPWEGENLYSVIFKQKNEPLPPLEEIRPDVPQFLRLALERAMSKDRDERWSSMDDFLARLDEPAATPEVGWDGREQPVATTALVPLSSAAVDHAPQTAVVARASVRWQRHALAASVILAVASGGVALSVSEPGWLPEVVSVFPTPESELAAAPVPAPLAAFAPPLDPGLATSPTPVAGLEASGSAIPAPAPEAPAAAPRAPAPVTPPPPNPSVQHLARAQEEMLRLVDLQPQPTLHGVRPRMPEMVHTEVGAVVPESYVAPQVQNMGTVRSQMARLFPAALAVQKIGGTTTVAVVVDEQGRVIDSELHLTSGHQELDRAALRVARMMRFSPAVRNGIPVTAKLHVPLVFEP
jgi:TonB family protein